MVSGPYHGFDQYHLLEALERLGPGFVGVTRLPATVADEEVLRLDRRGVRAVRFNVHGGGPQTLVRLDTLARRVFDLAGWHVELCLDARDLPDLAPKLGILPAVSIDHLALSRDGLPHLLRLAGRGARIKATGFAMFDPHVRDALRRLAHANPHALMFGTDLPSTGPRHTFGDDLEQLVDALDSKLVPGVLYDNAAALYWPTTPGA